MIIKKKRLEKVILKNKSERIVDIAITPNRPDCLGVRGLARDLSSTGIGKLVPLKRKNLNSYRNIILRFQ